jgi:hypothetical protein
MFFECPSTRPILHNILVPETLNPGFTGFMETTYAGILHREQWPDLDLKVDTDYAFQILGVTK